MAGRPSSFTPELGLDICCKIAEGMSLIKICEKDEYPAKSTVLKWVLEGSAKPAGDPLKVFSDQYALAQENRTEIWVEELIEIADDCNYDWETRYTQKGEAYLVPDHEHINRSRQRIDVRKWYASKLKPKKYGDKLQTVITDEDGKSIFKHYTPEQISELALKMASDGNMGHGDSVSKPKPGKKK